MGISSMKAFTSRLLSVISGTLTISCHSLFYLTGIRIAQVFWNVNFFIADRQVEVEDWKKLLYNPFDNKELEEDNMISLLLGIIYLSFISLGLPDALLGSAWPTMYGEFSVPVSYAGIISMIIALGTVVSSLQSDRLTRKLGTGKVTAISVAMTAAALFGFSFSHSFWMLCLWAIPYGLGAGSVDASLNNYVALHYESRHMSWLHCMWGVGASLGPYIMGFALTGGKTWNAGYRWIGMLQVVLTVILLLSLPMWKGRKA